MSETRFGSFEDLLADTDEAMRPIITSLRELVFAVDPEAIEVVRLGDRAATYGQGPRKMIDGYCYVLPHAKWVNLGFFRGAHLPDPDGLMEGTGKEMRHIKIRTIEAVAQPALRSLIEAAIDERRSALG